MTVLDLSVAVLPLADVLAGTIPDVSPDRPEGLEEFEELLGWIMWVATALCVVGVIGSGIAMAIAKSRGDGGEVIARLGWALAGAIVVGSAAQLVNALI
jgi:hypothetical protein